MNIKKWCVALIIAGLLIMAAGLIGQRHIDETQTAVIPGVRSAPADVAADAEPEAW